MRYLLTIIALLVSVNSYGADWIINGQAGHKDYIAQPGTGGPVSGNVFKSYTGGRVKTIGNAIQLVGSTGNEVAYTLDYTTNKAAGNDTGLLIKMTDTASPGTSYPFEIRTGVSGATTVASINQLGFSSAVRFIPSDGFFGSTYNPVGDNSTQSINNRAYSTASTVSTLIGTGAHTETSGAGVVVAVKPTYNQVTSTAANTDLLISRRETSLGSGAQLLIDAGTTDGTTHTSKFKVDNTGVITTASNVISTAGSMQVTSIGAFAVSTRSRMKSSADGMMEFRNSADNAYSSIVIAGISKAITTTATNLTLTAAHHTVLVTADATITLPAAASHSGRVYVIKKTYAAGTGVVIDGNASETIDDGATITLAIQYSSVNIQSDGTNWQVISSHL